MLFSSTVFVFLFLPFVLGVHFLLARKFRNFFILLCSLLFYAWGEGALVLLMMASICVNYAAGLGIALFKRKQNRGLEKTALTLGITANLLALCYYKYSHFVAENLRAIGIDIGYDTAEVVLPIGISFFTFQSISYLADVYRGTAKAQTSLIKLGMYISLFPQLIAGPIVRYVDISKEIAKRKISAELFASGIIRFIIGLAKKVIIANSVGEFADTVFAGSTAELSTELAWLGIICYTLQIYFDFSGYSDMAIGLGKMLGFNFKENFLHPYISRSIQEFWRRWHISLSSWFRDYLYIPLGGNRKGKYRTYVNLIIVFFLTGLWHGASWNFIVWGLFHGLFLVLERISFIRLSQRLGIFSRVYVLLVIVVGWVLFRAENINIAIEYLGTMFSISDGNYKYPYTLITPYFIAVFIAGIVFSTPIFSHITALGKLIVPQGAVYDIIRFAVYIALFIYTLSELAQGAFNPFIYFRF